MFFIFDFAVMICVLLSVFFTIISPLDDLSFTIIVASGAIAEGKFDSTLIPFSPKELLGLVERGGPCSCDLHAEGRRPQRSIREVHPRSQPGRNCFLGA